MNDYSYRPQRPPPGPVWFKGATVGRVRNSPDGTAWEVTSVSNRGRVIEWRNLNGDLVARSEITPGHPDYPQDPTPEQLRAESLARLRARPPRVVY